MLKGTPQLRKHPVFKLFKDDLEGQGYFYEITFLLAS
jgi:hypothetical protein